MDGSDDEKREREAKRKRDARAAAREQREKNRAAAKSPSNVIPLRALPGERLDEMVEVAVACVKRAVADPALSWTDKARCATAVLGPLSRAIEVRDFGERLSEIERKLNIGQRARGFRRES